MTSAATLTITFHGYWHCGTGRGAGATLDAVVSRCDAGLPTVPGRTLRGLLRDGVRQAAALGHLEAFWETDLFGTAQGGSTAESGDEDQRRGTTPGRLAVGSAFLAPGLRDVVRRASPSEAAALAGTLFASLGQTAIDETGTARRRSLRVVEVAMPLTLTASLELLDGYRIGPTDGDRMTTGWVEALNVAVPFVAAIGAYRQRGLGRCTLEVAA